MRVKACRGGRPHASMTGSHTGGGTQPSTLFVSIANPRADPLNGHALHSVGVCPTLSPVLRTSCSLCWTSRSRPRNCAPREHHLAVGDRRRRVDGN
jgi:hypothetical protein